MTDAELWTQPGGRLLRKLLPAWRAVTPEGAVDDFLGRQLAPVVEVLGSWLTKKEKGEADLRDKLDEKTADELRRSPHTLDALAEAMVPATRVRVAQSVTRLLNRRQVWRLVAADRPALYAHVSLSILGQPPPRNGRSRGGLPSPDEVHGAAIRADAARIAAHMPTLSPGKPLDQLRPDADGRALANALLDLTAPRRSRAEVQRYLRTHNFDKSADAIKLAGPHAPVSLIRDRVWNAVFSEGERLSRVAGTPEHLRVLPEAIGEGEDAVPWVAVRRRMDDGRFSLVRVDVDVVKESHSSIEIRPTGDVELHPGDMVHLWTRSTPKALAELYEVLEGFMEDREDKPVELAHLRALLYWTGAMIDTPQCRGEAKKEAIRAFNKAKLYYDVVRERHERSGQDGQLEPSVWSLGVLHRIGAAASAVAKKCADGTPIGSLDVVLDMDDPLWPTTYPGSMNTPLLRALYRALGHNPRLARRVDAAVRRIDLSDDHEARESQIAAAIAPHVGPHVEETAKLIVRVLNLRDSWRAFTPEGPPIGET